MEISFVKIWEFKYFTTLYLDQNVFIIIFGI